MYEKIINHLSTQILRATGNLWEIAEEEIDDTDTLFLIKENIDWINYSNDLIMKLRKEEQNPNDKNRNVYNR